MPRALIADRGTEAAIASNRTRELPIPGDVLAYTPRDPITRLFNAFNHFRRIATSLDGRAVPVLAHSVSPMP